MKSLTFVLCLCLLSQTVLSSDCWNNAAVGRKWSNPTSCSEGTVLINGECIQNGCPANTSEISGGLCIENCPQGFKTNGDSCIKPAMYSTVFDIYLDNPKDRALCNSRNSQGCVKRVFFWYPSCRANFKEVDVLCLPMCPAGFVDQGSACGRPKRQKAVSSPICGENLEKLTGGKCFASCPNNNDPFGVGCVDIYACPEGKTACGPICMDSNNNTCRSQTLEFYRNPPKEIVDWYLKEYKGGKLEYWRTKSGIKYMPWC
jgi:hypothetical protein